MDALIYDLDEICNYDVISSSIYLIWSKLVYPLGVFVYLAIIRDQMREISQD